MTLNLTVGKHYRIPTERLAAEDLPVDFDVWPLPHGLSADATTGLVTGVVDEIVGGSAVSSFWRDRVITFVVS
jgi:hypothetical protein